jgi:hypothetical protein
MDALNKSARQMDRRAANPAEIGGLRLTHSVEHNMLF